MDIHVPDKPIHSWRDFALHLVTITIGILIALSLDGLIDVMHWRSVVHEAEANINAELRDNKQQIDDLAKTLANTRKDDKKIVSFLNDEIAHGKSGIHGFNLSHRIVGLSTTSWETAQAIGALGHMAYPEEKRFAGAYNLQRHFEDVQQKVLDNTLASISFFSDQDPTKIDRQELVRAHDQMLTTLASLEGEEQIASQLSGGYAEALGAKKEKGK